MNHFEKIFGKPFRVTSYTDQLEFDDAARFEFLKRLDDAPFEVTDWEAGFMESILSTHARQVAFVKKCQSTPAPIRFTSKQREKIDQMRKAYEGRLPNKSESGNRKAEILKTSTHQSSTSQPSSVK